MKVDRQSENRPGMDSLYAINKRIELAITRYEFPNIVLISVKDVRPIGMHLDSIFIAKSVTVSS
jgi:hypothetical protein